MVDLSSFNVAVEKGIREFSDNLVFKKIESKMVTLSHYQSLLLMLFHQTLHAAPTFALAGVNTPDRLMGLREYLLEHAGEETRHWDWLRSDLKNTGFDVTNLLTSIPPAAALEYVGMNYYFATVSPIARLGSAAVLEGIGARYGSKYGTEIVSQLSLNRDCATFFISHGTTDEEHTRDIQELIVALPLTEKDVRDLTMGASAAARVYKRMYNDAIGQEGAIVWSVSA